MGRVKIIWILLLLTFYSQSFAITHAEVLERVVAIVNDDVILLSEFREAVRAARDRGMTDHEILEEMINKLLLLKEARRFRIQRGPHKDPDSIIEEYIRKRIRPFIRISFEEMEAYYLMNKERFGDREFYEVKDEIEAYLIEKELNKKVVEHIEELRKRAYIRIQVSP